ELSRGLSSGNGGVVWCTCVGPTSYGKEHDQLTDLYYYGFRYFDPLSLTWTQADPLYRFVPDLAYDEPRRMNLYVFSLQNPLRFVDPNGMEPTAVGTYDALKKRYRFNENGRGEKATAVLNWPGRTYAVWTMGKDATSKAKDAYPNEPRDDSKQDAYRHALWSATMTYLDRKSTRLNSS